MPRSERLDAKMLRLAPINVNKGGGRLTDRDTLKAYKKHILKFYTWAKALGIKREHDIARNGYTKITLLQKYTDELVASGLRPTSVHTYIAPVCKGLGVGMEQIKKPSRLAKDIIKNTKQRQNAAGAAQAADLRNSRIVRFAEIVTVRPQAMVRLTIENLRVDENRDHIIAIRDKGGKESIQLILPHEVEFVRKMLSSDANGKPLASGMLPFSRKDLRQIAFSKYRIERAQKMEEYFEQRFNGWKNMPSRFPYQRQAREKAKQEAMEEKKIWIEKIMGKYCAAHPNASRQKIDKYRAQLLRESRIYIRGGNYERAVILGRPLNYDRIAVRIASIYTLSHWGDETTLRNYLVK